MVQRPDEAASTVAARKTDSGDSMAPDSEILDRLARSRFRSRFRLSATERSYADKKGRGTILSHTRDFVTQRLAPAEPQNDGRQTPMRGHPTFVAQHATATCCRSCLAKWHRIPRGRHMSAAEHERTVSLIMNWIDEQMGAGRRS